jgi:hypothetical protein
MQSIGEESASSEAKLGDENRSNGENGEIQRRIFKCGLCRAEGHTRSSALCPLRVHEPQPALDQAPRPQLSVSSGNWRSSASLWFLLQQLLLNMPRMLM